MAQALHEPLLPSYLNDIGGRPLLGRDEERELAGELRRAKAALSRLARRIRAQLAWRPAEIDGLLRRLAANRSPELEQARRHARRIERARELLTVANLRLVVHVVKPYAHHGVPALDLIQEGNLGLMHAVEKFDGERGCKFSTYAFWWIKQAVERAIVEKGRLIRIPVYQNEARKKLGRVQAELKKALGREAQPQELADYLRLPREKVEEVLNLVADPKSLEALRAGGEERALLEKLPDPAAESPDVRLGQEKIRTRLAGTMRDKLDEREIRVLQLRYGLGGLEPHTLQEVGRWVNLSRERVRQIERSALRKLQSSGDMASLLKETFE